MIDREEEKKFNHKERKDHKKLMEGGFSTRLGSREKIYASRERSQP